MKNYIVVAYDIADDKRRTKICNILLEYGSRVNYSVFECFITLKEISALKTKIQQEMKKKEDVVLFYQLCRECLEKADRIGAISKDFSVIKVI